MKYYYLKTIFIVASIFTTSVAFSQSGAIYSFYFKIDPLLTDYIKIENKSRTWLSGYSEEETMPDQLIDSIKLNTEQAFTAKLKMPVKMCYHKYKSEVRFTSEGINGVLVGLPELTTFKRGKEDCAQNSRYIRLDVQIYASGGTSITTVTTKTKLKPKVQITAKVVDEDNNEVWKKEVVLKDFTKIRSETIYYRGYDITKSEVLTPLDIYAMYMMGLDELMKE